VTDPARRLAPVVRLAPAKLNLTLAVVGRRADGFHNLHSVVVLLDLGDRLSLAVRTSGEDSIYSTGFAVGDSGTNLVHAAVLAGVLPLVLVGGGLVVLCLGRSIRAGVAAAGCEREHHAGRGHDAEGPLHV